MDGVYWWSVEDLSGNFLTKFTEDDVRFSLSCKFHIFHNEQEAKKFESKEMKLTAEEVINRLTQDLIERKILKGDEKMKLFDLAPILVNEYILPCAPSSDVIETVWRNYENQK